mmetsp:Transcript_19286/g.43750  ORF Transcript_19286/g.43750 Transcript_19286/m.43750 type:complete len:258 (+) Transcript_19286:443-1216(+)
MAPRASRFRVCPAHRTALASLRRWRSCFAAPTRVHRWMHMAASSTGSVSAGGSRSPPVSRASETSLSRVPKKLAHVSAPAANPASSSATSASKAFRAACAGVMKSSSPSSPSSYSTDGSCSDLARWPKRASKFLELRRERTARVPWLSRDCRDPTGGVEPRLSEVDGRDPAFSSSEGVPGSRELRRRWWGDARLLLPSSKDRRAALSSSKDPALRGSTPGESASLEPVGDLAPSPPESSPSPSSASQLAARRPLCRT